MVKYGTCNIRCLNCGYNKENRERINSDYREFKLVISESCQHFAFNVNVLTRNTYSPHGPSDEITYDVIICCQRCGTPHDYSCGATSCNVNSNSWTRHCCGAGHQVDIKLTPNSAQDIINNTRKILRLFR